MDLPGNSEGLIATIGTDGAMRKAQMYGEDANMVARFFMMAEKNVFKTGQEGRPIFEEHEYISIRRAGDKHTEVVRRASPMDKQRFAQQYTFFKQSKEDAVVGTPLQNWGQLSPTQILELNAIHVKTVEQLANMNDVDVGNGTMGLRDLKTRAKAWLDKLSSNESLLERIKQLESKLAETKTESKPDTKPSHK